MAKPEVISPEGLSDYLEVLTKAVFKSGLNLEVVQQKWPAFREAFDDFDVEKVATYGEDEIEALVSNDEIIRYRRKIEATVENANVMLEISEEHGSMEEYLDSFDDFQQQQKAVKKRFKNVGDSTAHWFLASVGQPVPEYERG